MAVVDGTHLNLTPHSIGEHCNMIVFIRLLCIHRNYHSYEVAFNITTSNDQSELIV